VARAEGYAAIEQVVEVGSGRADVAIVLSRAPEPL
jgi:hypothetical protein